jgi:glycine betaine/proline transport system substrate-binding protein
MREGEDDRDDIRAHTDAWIAENQEAFDSWVEAGRAAAQ